MTYEVEIPHSGPIRMMSVESTIRFPDYEEYKKICQWLAEHDIMGHDPEFILAGIRFIFDNEIDAMAFKLRWL